MERTLETIQLASSSDFLLLLFNFFSLSVLQIIFFSLQYLSCNQLQLQCYFHSSHFKKLLLVVFFNFLIQAGCCFLTVLSLSVGEDVVGV